jgi:hypothetical protein
MIEPKHSLKAAAAAITTILVVHSAHQSQPCIIEKYDCQEPEQEPADMVERGRPTGPTGPTYSPYMTTGPTGPGGVTGSGNLVASASTIAGTDAPMSFVSTRPQLVENPAPLILSPA